jgi:hypothetical protein
MAPDVRLLLRRNIMARWIGSGWQLGLALALCGLISGGGNAIAQDAKAKNEAKALAQEILDKGAALFDTKDAAAMARTYTASAELHIITRDESSGTFQIETIRGRDAIRDQYARVFDGTADQKTTSRNVVEYAEKVGDDVLVIHGTFAPNVADSGRFAFSQTRVRIDDQWKILLLDLYIIQGAR